MARQVDKPFAGGRWSESQYKQFVNRALRKAWLKWPVKHDVLKAASRPSQLKDKRTKFEYQCACCEEWFKRTMVQVDHIEPCGDMEDMNRFIATLFCEEDNLQVLCIPCHKENT